MKRNLQKILKELTEYLEKQGLYKKADIQTAGFVEAGTPKGEHKSLAYGDCAAKITAVPLASYSDYDDLKDEINSLLESKAADETLFDLVEKHLKEKGMKPSTAYRNAQISKQDFARHVRPGADTISRTMVFNLAIGLRLGCDETKKLLRSAGYGYNAKSKFDLIVMFCISKKLYDVTMVNMLLDEFRQPLLISRNSKEN